MIPLSEKDIVELRWRCLKSIGDWEMEWTETYEAFLRMYQPRTASASAITFNRYWVRWK